MFPKAALTFLLVGILSVNALSIPVARSPAPEPESQELDAWMLKRDLSYDLFSRELQAMDELFSREPKDWAEWVKREFSTTQELRARMLERRSKDSPPTPPPHPPLVRVSTAPISLPSPAPRPPSPQPGTPQSPLGLTFR